MVHLRHALQQAGWAWNNGWGESPDGLWPSEDSVLVWGMDLINARAWGLRWQQNAIVHCGPDMTAQLVLLR